MHQQGLGFYTKGTMTNIAGNLPAGARTPENMTHEGFERYWTNQLERRAAKYAGGGLPHGQTAGPGTGAGAGETAGQTASSHAWPRHAYETRMGERGEFNYAATGALGAPGDERNMTWVTLKNGQKMQVNKAGAEQFKGLANDLIDRGYPVSVKEGSGYIDRVKKGGTGTSMHAYGAALDISPERNPWHTQTTDMPSDIEQLAWSHGLSWGGRFRDPQHFEIMSPEAAAHKQKLLAAQGYDRAALDQQMTHRVHGTGDINVNVNAPKGTHVSGRAHGLFNKVKVQRKTQMEPAESSTAPGPYASSSVEPHSTP
jgi:hypothetical protein